MVQSGADAALPCRNARNRSPVPLGRKIFHIQKTGRATLSYIFISVLLFLRHGFGAHTEGALVDGEHLLLADEALL